VKDKYTLSVRFKMLPLGKGNGVDAKSGVWTIKLLGRSRQLDFSQEEAKALARRLPQD